MTEISVDEYLSKRAGFVRDNGAVLKATFRPPSSFDKEKRTCRFVMSTEEPDRDMDIVVQSGLDLTAFAANPIAFYNHCSWEPPIGKWSDVTIVNGRPRRTEGTLEMIPAGIDEDADCVFEHLALGTIRAASIGFFPKTIRQREREMDSGCPGYEILEAELVECSVVNIPANASALAKGAMGAARGDPVQAREIVEHALDTWARDPVTNLLIPRADFEKQWEVTKRAVQDDTMGKVSVKLAVDTSEVEAAVAKTETMLDRIASKFAKIFGKAEPEPIALPSEEDIAAARAKTADTLDRLRKAGLI